MLDKFKDIGSQVVSKTGDAVGGITSSVKGGMESLSNTASNMTDTLNEKAVRASTAQVCTILQIALDELKSKPLSEQRVTLTAAVNFGVAALEMQVHVDPANKHDAAPPVSTSSNI
jgi:hypothetical protein